MPGSSMAVAIAFPRFDLAGLMEILGGDPDFLDEFVTLFKVDSDQLVRDIQEALDRVDPQALEFSAHSLQGMLSNLGDSAALERSRRLARLGSQRDLEGADELISSLFHDVHRIQHGLASL